MSTDTPQTDVSTEPPIYAIDEVPGDYQINGRFELHPNDISTTPPCTICLDMSPQSLTLVEPTYRRAKPATTLSNSPIPRASTTPPFEWTTAVVRTPTGFSSGSPRNLADEKGYRMERKSIVDVLEAEQADD